jgi:hypothetical protein
VAACTRRAPGAQRSCGANYESRLEEGRCRYLVLLILERLDR